MAYVDSSISPPTPGTTQATPSPSPSFVPSLPKIPSINQPLSVKLDKNNFLIWKSQLLNIIIGNGLESFINGSSLCPVAFLEDASSNPAFFTWHRYNFLLMSWIYASVSESMLGQLVDYSSALEIWEALESLFASASFARLSELRHSLLNFRKDGTSILSYILKFRQLCNTLAAIGEPISYNDHLHYLLNGLGLEYNPFVTTIQVRSDQPTVKIVHSLLLSYDARLECQSSSTSVHSLQANLANINPLKPKPKFQ